MTARIAPEKALGDEIRRRRKQAGLTIEALAERSGMSPGYLGSIELGTRDPSLSKVLSIAHGLGVTTGELLGPKVELTPEAIRAGHLFETARPELRENLSAYLREFVRPPPEEPTQDPQDPQDPQEGNETQGQQQARESKDRDEE